MFSLDWLIEPILRWLNEKRDVDDMPLCHFEKICESIEPCDVLLIEGRSRVAEVIKLITQSPWSHAALYIGRPKDIKNPRLRDIIDKHFSGDENTQLLAESELGLGTTVRPISVYEMEHIRISRPKNLSDEDKHHVIRYALSCLGYAYDVRQILDLARFLFPWRIMPRKFRSTLFSRNIGEATKTVCSTMIAESFNFVQFPILPYVKCDDQDGLKLYKRNPKFCVPRDFDYSPYFEIIKYPFIDYIDKSKGYRGLPWQGEFDPEYEVSLQTVRSHDESLEALYEAQIQKENEKLKKIRKQEEKKNTNEQEVSARNKDDEDVREDANQLSDIMIKFDPDKKKEQ